MLGTHLERCGNCRTHLSLHHDLQWVHGCPSHCPELSASGRCLEIQSSIPQDNDVHSVSFIDTRFGYSKVQVSSFQVRAPRANLKWGRSVESLTDDAWDAVFNGALEVVDGDDVELPGEDMGTETPGISGTEELGEPLLSNPSDDNDNLDDRIML